MKMLLLVLLSVLSPMAAEALRIGGQEAPRDDYGARLHEYLEICVYGDSLGGEGLWTQLARLELGVGPIDESIVRDALDFVAGRNDTADFRVAALLRILYQYAADPLLDPLLRDEIEETLLGFKYWIDEPGTDSMVYWSENHQILFASAEYLAGSLYPDATFPNAGMSGRDHADKARARIEQWLEDRFRAGFSEWHSNVYYDEDFAALQNLADFAPDPEIAVRAAMVLDLLHFDIGLNSHRGMFGVSHGRAYSEHVTGGRRESTACVSRLVSGEGIYNSRGSRSAVWLATSRRYRPPRVIRDIAADQPDELIDRERMSLRFADAADFDLDFQSPESAIRWWGMGAYAAWQVVDLTFATAEAYDLWENEFFAPFADLVPLYELGLLPALSFLAQNATSGSVLSRVDTYTYRRPDYMLACAQDQRPGQLGFQTHLWQATIDLDAVVFTSHPGSLEGRTPGYWTGGWMPKVVQAENVAIVLYEWRPASLIVPTLVLPFTHAYFPRQHFDEVRAIDKWTLGRKGDAYLALFSNRPTHWNETGEWAGKDLIADGTSNTWICEMGCRTTDGTFDEFVDDIVAAEVKVLGKRVTYHSPSQGKMKVGWRTRLKIDGRPVQIHHDDRFDNPYCRTSFGQDPIRIERQDEWLELDFAGAERRMSGG